MEVIPPTKSAGSTCPPLPEPHRRGLQGEQDNGVRTPPQHLQQLRRVVGAQLDHQLLRHRQVEYIPDLPYQQKMENSGKHLISY